MTILNNGIRNQYTATSGQTVFAYNFEILDQDDIKVYEGANTTPLIRSTDYTVSGVGAENGGSITLTSGATAGVLYTLIRDTAPERLTDYQESGDFLATEINSEQDRQWAVIQELVGNQDRFLQVNNPSAAPLPLSLDDPVVGNLLRWDTTSNVGNVSPSSITPSGSITTDYSRQVSDYAALISIAGSISDYSNGQVITITDNGIAGSGKLVNTVGHGITTTSGVQVRINDDWYWQRIYQDGEYDARWWGCQVDGDGSGGGTDDTANLQQLIDEIPYGMILVDGVLNFTRLVIKDDIIFKGVNQAKSLLLCTDSTTLDSGVSFGSAIRKADDNTRTSRFGLQDIGLQGVTSQLNMQNVIGLNLCACERGYFKNFYIANFGQAAIALARAEGGTEGLGFTGTAGQDGNYNVFIHGNIFNCGQYSSAKSAVEFKYKANSNSFYGIHFKGGVDRGYNLAWANGNSIFGGAVEASETVARFSTFGISNHIYGVRGEGISGDAYIFANGASFNEVHIGRLTSLTGAVYTMDASSEGNLILGLAENYQKNYAFDPATTTSSDHNNGMLETSGILGDVDYPLYVKSKTFNDPSKYPVIQLVNTLSAAVAANVLASIEFYNSDNSASAEGVSAAIRAVIENSLGGTGLSFQTGTGAALVENMKIDRNGVINMPNLPTSSAGLSAGDLWNNSGVVNIV